MEQLPDDPIIACMMRTGYPPWFQYFEREGNDDDAEDKEDYL